MKTYPLYLESGPRRRTTMVHVLDLLGCIAQGSTTDEALEDTPGAIRAYLAFLQRHGEPADPQEPFQTQVAEHVMQGSWLGYGDPTPGFTPDFEALEPRDLQASCQRLGWVSEDLIARIQGLPANHLRDEPPSGGRSILRIIEHLAESQAIYLRYTAGRVPGVSHVLKTLKGEPEDPATILAEVYQISLSRLQDMTSEQMAQQVPHGQVTWTARRGLRRMLEHAWEHLMEIERRMQVHG